MFKKIGFPMMALFGLLALAPLNQAKAAVRFGVYVGAPVCVRPVYRPYPIVPAPVYFHDHFDHHLDQGRDFRARGRR